jgi:hypothetical protein
MLGPLFTGMCPASPVLQDGELHGNTEKLCLPKTFVCGNCEFASLL